MLSKIYEQNIAYRTRTIGGKTILIGENNCYELNEVALEIWNCLDDEKSVEDIVNHLSKEFDVDKKALENDVYEFIKHMECNNIIRVFGNE